MATLRVGDPLDKNTDIGAINSAEQLARIRELSDDRRRRRAPSAGRRRASCPTAGFWFAPTIFTGVSQAHRIAREEIFGPVLSVLTFRTPAEAVEKANNTPYGLSAGVWTEKGSRILAMADKLRAGVVWANTFNKFDPTVAVRRLQGVRLRPRGRPARAGGVPCLSRLTRLAVRKTYKLFIGGAFPRSESGRSYRGATDANVALASRKDVRDAVRAARAARSKWAGATAYNRGQILYRVAEMLEGRRDAVRRARRRRGRSGRGDRPLGLVRRLVRQDRPGLRRRQPGRRAVLQHLRARADRRGRRRRAGRSLLGLVSVIAPAIVTGNTVRGAGRAASAAARDDAGRGAGHLRPARRRGQHPHRRAGRDRAVAGRRTWTSTRST